MTPRPETGLRASGVGATSVLHEARLDAVSTCLLALGARSVLDLGCGDGDLLATLARQSQFERIVGIDISQESLASARQTLMLDITASGARVEVMCASFTEANKYLCGFDAGVMLETIEHIDPGRLSLVENAVFRDYRPRTVLVTTPNQEYNLLHGIPPGAFRHADHRFEWDRPHFRRWASGIADRNNYTVRFDDIGPLDPERGASTQMAIFEQTKNL